MQALNLCLYVIPIRKHSEHADVLDDVAGALQKAAVSPVHVEEVFMGNVLSADLGQVCSI